MTFLCRSALPQACPKKRRMRQTTTFPCRRVLLQGAHVRSTPDQSEASTDDMITQHPCHHIPPFRSCHPRPASPQTWQGSHHRLQVFQTYHFPRPFRASLRRLRYRRQAFLEARQPASSRRRRLLALLLLHPLASGRLREGTLPHPWVYSTAFPLRLQASSRDAGPRLSHRVRDLVLLRTPRRDRLYLQLHLLLLWQHRQRCLPRHSYVISRRRARRSCLLRSNANAPPLEGA